MENIEQRYLSVLKVMHSYLSERMLDPEQDMETISFLLNGIAEETRATISRKPEYSHRRIAR